MYTWEPEKEEEFKATWNLYCQTQYKKLLHKWRKMDSRPGHVSGDVWAAWMQVWSGDKWKQNSETARKNRNSEVEGPGTGVTKHTAGSRSIIEHALKLEAELKRKTDCWEVFCSTHRHMDGNFVDARSQAINDAISAKVAESSQTSTDGEEPNTPSQDDINNIYYDVVGGLKKSRLYGLGSQGKIIFPHAMSTSRGKNRPSSSSVVIEELKSENAELKTRMVELEKTSAENTELRARMSDLEKTMQAFMSRMVFSQTLQNSSAFPDIDSDETQP